jgi:hypothetical protein
VKHFLGEMKMKTFDFSVTIAGENLDIEVALDILRTAIEEGYPAGTLSKCGYVGHKTYTEHGWKVARARKFGVTAEAAGDAVVSKRVKEELVTA